MWNREHEALAFGTVDTVSLQSRETQWKSDCLLGRFLPRQTYGTALFKRKSPCECHSLLAGIIFFPGCSVFGLAGCWDENRRRWILTERETTMSLVWDFVSKMLKSRGNLSAWGSSVVLVLTARIAPLPCGSLLILTVRPRHSSGVGWWRSACTNWGKLRQRAA